MHLTLNSEKGGEFAVIVTDKANLALFDSVRENIVSFFYGERTSFVQTLLSSVKIAKFPSEEDIADVNTIQDESFLWEQVVCYEKAMMGVVPPMADAMALDHPMKRTPSSENISRSDFQDTASFRQSYTRKKMEKQRLIFHCLIISRHGIFLSLELILNFE